MEQTAYVSYLRGLTNRKLKTEYKNLYEAVCMTEEYTDDNKLLALASREMEVRGLKLTYGGLHYA